MNNFLTSTRAQKKVILTNGVLRFAQIVVGVVTLGLYAQQSGFWLNHSIQSKIGFEITVGTVTTITGLVLCIFPFILSYRPVAFAAGWDLMMFILYSVAFGVMRAIFSNDHNESKAGMEVTDDKAFVEYAHKMRGNLWVNLAGMILFLISAIMGITLIITGRVFGRKSIIESDRILANNA
ncbi:hypothetical protein LTR10_015990 [Elasticomyces elasticus]|uniref:MARVEL domain-containing protein n=1 Tax=Exophiala sideris TaxID=1016849 RepID=A0ABR0J1Q7_9EURO|nr:hypothetical protein LTR10_015990 [Elasticomyces elasticus]KAK5024672.1 hypothetical protein LTS07_008518 [Exophiala sideris]KAK5030765.1 hypothetical protein LTR13_008119 [Exophiala sideris]KAK5054306.1 hypothetical protein LTR69_008921 [Exophiala sideris]KAK5179708.1 hypothetical protein LTR44_007876 [Eurotiomycetes sp. CCFEE 6388]